MKYLIKESKFEKLVTDYINELFPIDKLNYSYPFDDDGEEDHNAMRFSLNYSDEPCFRWYRSEYFYAHADIKNRAPVIVMGDNYLLSLNGYFGDGWHEPFKKWLMENFNLPVKTIE